MTCVYVFLLNTSEELFTTIQDRCSELGLRVVSLYVSGMGLCPSGVLSGYQAYTCVSSLVHKDNVAICNLFILEVCNLNFLILDYWLLRGLAQANTTGSKSHFLFLARLLAPDYTGVGGSLT